MIDFLEEVRYDLSLAEAEKRHFQYLIQSISSQMDDFKDEIDDNHRELTYIINLFS